MVISIGFDWIWGAYAGLVILVIIVGISELKRRKTVKPEINDIRVIPRKVNGKLVDVNDIKKYEARIKELSILVYNTRIKYLEYKKEKIILEEIVDKLKRLGK